MNLRQIRILRKLPFRFSILSSWFSSLFFSSILAVGRSWRRVLSRLQILGRQTQQPPYASLPSLSLPSLLVSSSLFVFLLRSSMNPTD
ncbi:hypothetical protein BDW68DRAFT_170937 [Aspergillus falconensis]